MPHIAGPSLVVALSACAACEPGYPGSMATNTDSQEHVGAISDGVGVETVDLGDLPSLDRTLGFVVADASQASGSGSLVRSQGENWRSCASGVYGHHASVWTWHHRIRTGAVGRWSFDPDEHARDLLGAPSQDSRRWRRRR